MQKGLLRKIMEFDTTKELKTELLSTAHMLGVDGKLDLPFLVDNDLLTKKAANMFEKLYKEAINDNEEDHADLEKCIPVLG